MTTIEQALKDTADRAVSLAAGVSNRLGSLKALAESPLLTDEQFFGVIGQARCTIERDLQWAHEDFAKSKAHYEAVCRMLGVPAYSVWNED